MTSQSVQDLSVVTKQSYCKVCMSHCGLLVDVVDDERIIKVRGDKDHLTGGYTCPKGRATG